MDLTEARLKQVLGRRPFQLFAEVGSSNDTGLAWLAEGAAAGSVVVAEEQTKGRGRLGRAWYAPAGTALMFSYLMRPKADELPYVSMTSALAVCEAVETLGANAGIKWANDVQIGGRKLCGVLPEALWRGEALGGVVLGIGINVRIDFTGTPFQETAVSLETLVGQVDRAELLARVLERLDFWSGRLAADALFDAWQARLNMIGRQVSINGAGGVVQGTAEMVDRQGGLHVRGSDGVLRRVIAGDIALG